MNTLTSMTTLHSFATSRESILPLFSPEAQQKRSLPDASMIDLYLFLQGMLFTHIQLDDFLPSLGRFMERLALDSTTPAQVKGKQIEERDWIMMGVVNIASVLEYGRDGGVIKKAGSSSTVRDTTNVILSQRDKDKDIKGDGHKRDDIDGEPDLKHMEVDEPEDMHEDETHELEAISGDTLYPPDELPPAFRLALQLTFMMLSHVLRHPIRKATPFARPALNPYITVILTWLAAAFKLPRISTVLERWVPWEDLSKFLSAAPRSILWKEVDNGSRLTQGSTPLPEDWCMRGMEWAARRTFERGFWKIEAGVYGELEVLNRDESTTLDMTDGIIEDDDDDDAEYQKDREKRSQQTLGTISEGLR